MKNIILFPHPGGEHGREGNSSLRPPKIETSKVAYKGSNYIRWHKGQHARKFLKNNGNYIDKSGNLIENKNITFWSEWEAQSKIIEEYNIERAENELPKYLQIPFWDTIERSINTDPFIFGDNYYWAFCRQGNQPKLTKLSSGDLVLFGSKINDKFVIDTVFVIREGINYSWNTYHLGTSGLTNIIKKCPEYDEITLKAGSCSSSSSDYYYNYRLYVSVNYSERNNYDEIFSFFPTKEYNNNNGFKRPEIDLSNYFSYDDIKINPQSARQLIVEDNVIKEIWQEIKKQTEEQGLNLGIFTEIPKGHIEPVINIGNNILGAIPAGKMHAPYRDKLLKPKTKYPPINNFPFNKIITIEIEIEFQSNKQYGALIGNQNRDLNPDEYNPVIYIGTDGYLYGKLWDDEISATKYLKSNTKVADSKKYVVKYTANFQTNEQKLFLNNVLQKEFSPKLCNKYKKNGDLEKEYKIFKKYDSQPFFKTDFWQLGTAYTRNKPKTDGFWFAFDGMINSANIIINDKVHYPKLD